MLINSYLGVSIYLVEGNTFAHMPAIKWPNGNDQLKVPSRIAYPADNPSFTMSSPCWGFGVEPDMMAYSLTKLFLDSNAESTEFDDQVLRQRVSLGNPQQALHPDRNKPPVDVVADYLSHVLNFVWGVLRREMGISLDNLPVHLQFTIPATWSDRGRALSKQAILRAWDVKRPWDTFKEMSESDAAAESVHNQLMRNTKLQTGDRVLVCDCGSGTVVRLLLPAFPPRLEFEYQGALLTI